LISRTLAFLTLALTVLSGCSSGPDAKRAVERYLESRTDLNLARMEVAVERVEQEGDEATAFVTISAPDGASMQMIYKLRREGSEWAVVPSEGSSGSPHGGAAPGGGEPSLPQGHPPVGGDEGSGAQPLPPDHPPVGERSEGKEL